MIYRKFQDIQLSGLGLGMMRLPVLGGNDGAVDEAAAAKNSRRDCGAVRHVRFGAVKGKYYHMGNR